MEENDFLSNDDNNHAGSSQNTSTRTGLRLILPPLNVVRALKGKKKSAKSVFHDVVPVKKIPRPIKLKPLKEVLTKLIGQIKRRDDYAFFLHPVDVSQVQGYADIVKNPMDLGTMTTKVDNGKYRSLEEFAADLRLVTGNAKIFNPPGTIYHTEADRIEAWALDHINKAAASVIEYETDWNIDIEHDEEAGQGDGDDQDAAGKAMQVDGGVNGRGRSPSVASVQAPIQGSRKKGKKQPGVLSESWEEDGHLPGHKDGVGVFPPGSDWAELMLALKLKGKRYRTKKERMRMEKGGPPFAADGSVDYPEMEDPFTVLSTFLLDPPSRPPLTPLYPAATPSTSSPSSFPGPVALSTDRPPYEISYPSAKKPSSSSVVKTWRKHWTVARNTTGRKAKEKEEEDGPPPWKAPREPEAVDYGSFAVLAGKVVEDAQRCNVDLSSASHLLDVIKGSLELKAGQRGITPVPPANGVEKPQERNAAEGYWEGWGPQADDYLRDIVYGGVDGFAYIRSLAEFVQPPTPDEEMTDEEDDPSFPHYEGLGMPLAKWVEESVVDPLTEGRHRLLRETTLYLTSLSSHGFTPSDSSTLAQINLSLHDFPTAASHLTLLKHLTTQKLDMATLIRDPTELFKADETWSGAKYMEEQRRKIEKEKEDALVASPEKGAAEYLAFAIQSHKEAEDVSSIYESREVLEYALGHSADQIVEVVRKRGGASTLELQTNGDSHDRMDVDGEEENVVQVGLKQEEDPSLKQIRLDLLALAKRAPLDSIARIPARLVPEHIRHVVPTIESASSPAYS